MERFKIDSCLKVSPNDKLQLNMYYALEDILAELKNISEKLNTSEVKKPEVKQETKQEKFVCDRCGKEFDKKKQLAGHKIRCKGSG